MKTRPRTALPSGMRSLLRGLYVILDPAVHSTGSLVDLLKEAADHGARLFQYRDKTATMKDAYRLGLTLKLASADAGALLIVNDRCDLAIAIDADGVHVGQKDLPLEHARRLLGDDKILGISTHTPEQLTAAAAMRPDYIAYGPIFSTHTKSDHAAIVGVEGLRAVRRLSSLPLFAIGGISVESVEAIRDAGADGVAVISAVTQAPDIGGAVEDFVRRLT
jgi:thiamine-phosphate pyrophosphorylase